MHFVSIMRLLYANHCAQCKRDSFGAPKSASIAKQVAPGVRVRRSHRLPCKTATLDAMVHLEDIAGEEESALTNSESEYSPGERCQPWFYGL